MVLLAAFLGGCASSGTDPTPEQADRVEQRVHVYEEGRLPEAVYERLGTVTGAVCKTEVYSGNPTRAEALSALKQQVARAGGNGILSVTCRRGSVDRCSRARRCTGTAIRVRSVDAIPRMSREQSNQFGDGEAQSGTGWVLASRLVVTSHRLVEDRSSFSVSTPDTTVDAELVARDAVHGLALLRTPQSFALPSPLPLAAESGPTGERVFTAGYPNVEAAGLRAATGIVSAQSGAMGDARVIRTTVVPPSDLGGAPLLNFRGEVIGVLVPPPAAQGFSPTTSASASVSYAVKNEYLRRLLTRPDSVSDSDEDIARELPLRREAPALPPLLDAVRTSILRVTAR